MKMSLNSLRFNLKKFKLSQYDLVEVKGADREIFFQGQVTNDLDLLNVSEAQWTTRLNRVGKIQSFFIIGKKTDSLLILCEKILTQNILEDFNKYIIMDDVELSVIQTDLYAYFNGFLDSSIEGLFSVKYCGIETVISTTDYKNVEEASIEEFEKYRILSGTPLWGVDANESHFVNDTYLNEIAVSYKKGCFLGQETAAKIQNNRGAAYFPVILKLKNFEKLDKGDFFIDDKKAGVIRYQVDNLLVATILRDYRVENKNIEIISANKKVEAQISSLPYFRAQDRNDVAEELYHLGVDEFQKANAEEAMSYMEKAIAFNPAYADPYESIGVILGRREKYDEGIQWMDKLLSVNASSVMAHTNKSLFLMKLGKIEEAEAEKGLATVKSFAVFGEEAKLKKALLEEKQKKEADMQRREGMFKQVLELDEDDTVALYGLADIAFYREEYKAAVDYLERVVKLDEKYSVAYLLLGKSLEATGNLDRAMQVYKKGIDVASKRGDMMPANDMQSRLNQLIMVSRLS